MILKIKRYLDYEEWWLLDNIHKISKSKTLKATREELIGDGVMRGIVEDHDICIMDVLDNTSEFSSNHKFDYTILICRGKTTDSEFSVIFDTEAYICNDDGKTIERIVV